MSAEEIGQKMADSLINGLLVIAIVGGAIIPEIQGILADHIGIHHAFIIPVICYMFIAYYGWKGSRVILPDESR